MASSSGYASSADLLIIYIGPLTGYSDSPEDTNIDGYTPAEFQSPDRSCPCRQVTSAHLRALPSDDPGVHPDRCRAAGGLPQRSPQLANPCHQGSDCVTYDYDQIGEMTAMTDQNGTTHDYTYDGVGRLLTDTIASFARASTQTPIRQQHPVRLQGLRQTALGHQLQRLQARTTRPRRALSTRSFINTTRTAIWTRNTSAHGGPVNTATSLYVGYGCDDSTAVVNGVTTADTGWRPTTLEDPTTAGTATTRLLTYSYSDLGSSDDAINRLQSIGDGTETAGVPTTPDELASYAYLGVATIAKEDYTQLQIGLD